MRSLGEELTRLRRLKGWSLREVEDKTKKKVSNSYLYQLENDAVKEPSPNILHELANVYEVSYAALMRLAGFFVPGSGKKNPSSQGSVAFSSLNLTDEEEEQVLDFVAFLRSKNKSKR